MNQVLKPFDFSCQLNGKEKNCIQLGPIRLSVQIVTPALAQLWLTKNTANRRLRTRVVNNYAVDMANNNWEVKPVAICFDEDGNLGNGQHTLNAIIKSGRSQLLLIGENVPHRSIALMDNGLKRSVEDIAHFLGASIDTPRASVAKLLLLGRPSSDSGLTFDVLYDAYRFYAESIEFVFEIGGGKLTGLNSITRSVAAMAWYSQDRVRIGEFFQCIRTGVAQSDGDTAAIRLRDLLLKGKTYGGGGSLARAELFNKTKSALSLFLKHRPASKLYGTEQNLFPYPRFDQGDDTTICR